MDVDSQVEEFDSSSSSESESSSEDEEQQSEEEGLSEQSGEEVPPADQTLGGGDWAAAKSKGSRKRLKNRKRHAAGMRKKLRTHYESVEDFNPEARSAQSAELERIRRLELQQSIVSPPPHIPPPTTHPHHPQLSVTAHSKAGSESPEMVVVDFSHKATPPADTIVIDSGSDSDSTEKSRKAVAAKPEDHVTSGRGEALHRKYDDPSVPRPDGRLIVNINHAPNEPDVFLAPQVARIVKPHQIGGIRFLYDNIIESVSRYSTSPGFGCILAHSMGLGKTLQVISFIDVFMRYTPARHTLCVVPVNTLQNWINEFDRWLPVRPANQNPSASHVTLPPMDDTQYREFGVFLLSENCRTMEARVKVISEWQEVGGVLLIGYEMFRLLSLSIPSLAGNKMAIKRRKNTPAKANKGTIDLDETEREMDALIGIQRVLCDPGPDLVVCDEGHRIKNDYTNISQALKRIRTRRRIVMTGYPLQNNLVEYWCMVDFVRPKYLGTKQEFADLFERPITNGQCADSTPNDVRLMRFRSHVLHSLLEGFVLRRGHEILRSTLPPKFEHVLFLRPSEAQAILYNYNMSLIQQGGGVSTSTGPLKAFAVCTKIWNHPDIYYQEVAAQEAKDPSLTTLLDDAGLSKSGLKVTGGESSCKLDWPHPQLPSYQPGSLLNSPKMMVLMELIDKSVHYGDKILVFSQSLSTLSYVEKLLSQRPIPVPDVGLLSGNGTVQYQSLTWTKNKNFYRIDGSTSSMERDKLINSFNSPANKDCWVFLLSTKAGCLGINLIGANRVVVLDVSWNPCYDAQAVCRVYRYGQTKPCYIYRLVCDGTMERKIYDRQISKQGMSDRVVDHLQPERHLSTQDIISLITPLTVLPPSRDLSPSAQEFLFDPVLMSLCCSLGQLLTKLPFKHESLLMDSANERMTDLEKYLALRGFQADWKALKSGPSSIHEYRAMQAKQATNIGLPPAHLATPTMVPPPSLAMHSNPMGQALPAPVAVQSNEPMGKTLPAPVITTPNEPVEVICLDSDEDEQKLTTPPKPPPPEMTLDPVKTVPPNLASILSSRAQTHFTASQMLTQQTPTPTEAHPHPPPSTSSSHSASTSIEPTTVTTTQLSELSEGIVDSLKSQLLSTSLTHLRQDQNKMAGVEQLKKKSDDSVASGEPSVGGAVGGAQVVLAVTSSAESAPVSSSHMTSEQTTESTSSPQTSTPEELGSGDGTNIHLNSNTNNATEESTSLYPQGKYMTVAPHTSMDENVNTTCASGESWKTQPDKSCKGLKKERYGVSWLPPYPPPPPSTSYTPCSIPLLSPIAAHLLYLSTGTKLPSSPPEDVSKYPPIVSPTPSSPSSSQDDRMDWEYTPLTDEECDARDKSVLTPPTSSGSLVLTPPTSSGSRDGKCSKDKGLGSKPSSVGVVTMPSSVGVVTMPSSVGVVNSTSEGVWESRGHCSVTQSIVHPMICSPLPLGKGVTTARGQSATDDSIQSQGSGVTLVQGQGVTATSLQGQSTTTTSVPIQSALTTSMQGQSALTALLQGQSALTTSRQGQSATGTTVSVCVTASCSYTHQATAHNSTSVQYLTATTSLTSQTTSTSSTTTPFLSLSSGQSLAQSPSQEGMEMLTELLNELSPSLSQSLQSSLPPLNMPSNASQSLPPPLSMPSSASSKSSSASPGSQQLNISVFSSQSPNMLGSVSASQSSGMPSNVSTYQPLSVPSNVSTYQPLSVPSNVSTYQPLSVPSNVSTYQPLSMPSNVSSYQSLTVFNNASVSQLHGMPGNISPPQTSSVPSNVSTSQPLGMPSSDTMSESLGMPENVFVSQLSGPRNVPFSHQIAPQSSSNSPVVSMSAVSVYPSSAPSLHPSSAPSLHPTSAPSLHPSSITAPVSLHSIATTTTSQVTWSPAHTASQVTWSPTHFTNLHVSTVQSSISQSTPVTSASSLAMIPAATSSQSATFYSARDGDTQRSLSAEGRSQAQRFVQPVQADQVERRRHPSTNHSFDSAKSGRVSPNDYHMKSRENHMTSKNSSKPKWIRSFSESEVPGKGGVSISPPSPSMYDPQPILCIDNWAKSGGVVTSHGDHGNDVVGAPPTSDAAVNNDVFRSDVNGLQTTELSSSQALLKKKLSQPYTGRQDRSLSTSAVDGVPSLFWAPPISRPTLISPPPTLLGSTRDACNSLCGLGRDNTHTTPTPVTPHQLSPNRGHTHTTPTPVTPHQLSPNRGHTHTTPIPVTPHQLSSNHGHTHTTPTPVTPHQLSPNRGNTHSTPTPVTPHQLPPQSAVAGATVTSGPVSSIGTMATQNKVLHISETPWQQRDANNEVTVCMYHDGVPGDVTDVPLSESSDSGIKQAQCSIPAGVGVSLEAGSGSRSDHLANSKPQNGKFDVYKALQPSASGAQSTTLNGHDSGFSAAPSSWQPLAAASGSVRSDTPTAGLPWRASQSSYSPTQSERAGFGASRGQRRGETCLMPSIFQEPGRPVKKTAVVTPYCVVKSETASPKTDQGVGGQLLAAAVVTTTPSQKIVCVSSPEKMVATYTLFSPDQYSCDMVSNKLCVTCPTPNQQGGEEVQTFNNKPSNLVLNTPPRNKMSLQFDNGNGMGTQISSVNGMSPQLSNEANPQLPNTNGMSPQLSRMIEANSQRPSVNGMSPQLPYMNGTNPQHPSANGMSPQLPEVNRTSLQFPRVNGTNPQLASMNKCPQDPFVNGANPQLTCENRMTPQLPSVNGMNSQLSCLNGTNPQLPSGNRMSPQLPSVSLQLSLANETRPQLSSVSRMSPQLSGMNPQLSGMSPQLSCVNGMNPQLLSAHNTNPSHVSVNGISPQLPCVNGTNPQLPSVNKMSPQLTRMSPQLPRVDGTNLQLPIVNTQLSSVNRIMNGMSPQVPHGVNRPQLPSVNGMSPQVPHSVNRSNPQLPSVNGMSPQVPHSVSPQLPSVNGMSPQVPHSVNKSSLQLPSVNGMSPQVPHSVNRSSPQLPSVNGMSPDISSGNGMSPQLLGVHRMSPQLLGVNGLNRTSPQLSSRARRSVSTDNPQQTTKVASHSPVIPTPTPISPLCGQRSSPHLPSEGVASNGGIHFNFPLPTNNAGLPPTSPDLVQQGVCPSGQKRYVHMDSSPTPNLRESNRVSPLVQRAHSVSNTTPHGDEPGVLGNRPPTALAPLQRQTSDPSLNRGTCPQPSTTSLLQSGSSAFSSVPSGHGSAAPSLPTWVGPSPASEQLSPVQSMCLSEVRRLPQPGAFPPAVSMTLGTQTQATPTQFPNPSASSPTNSNGVHLGHTHLQASTATPTPHTLLMNQSTPSVQYSPATNQISSNMNHLQTTLSPCHPRAPQASPVSGVGVSPSQPMHPNLPQTPLPLTGGLVSPTPQRTVHGPALQLSPQLQQNSDYSIAANHVTFVPADSALRNRMCNTPPLHFRSVPTGHAQNLSPVASTTSPISANLQNRQGGQNGGQNVPSYAIPSLYGCAGKPAASVRQLLSPTHSHAAQLPSFDQIRSSSKRTYSNCHGNCTVGIATRMCK